MSEADEASGVGAACTVEGGFGSERRPKATSSPYGSRISIQQSSIQSRLPRVALLKTSVAQAEVGYSPGPDKYVAVRDRSYTSDVGNFGSFPRPGPAATFPKEAANFPLPADTSNEHVLRREPGRSIPGRPGLCLQAPSWKGFSGVRVHGVAPPESFVTTPCATKYSTRTGTEMGSLNYGKTFPWYTAGERAFLNPSGRYTKTDRMTMSQMQKGWAGGYGPDKLSHYPGAQHYLCDLDHIPSRTGHGNFGYRGLYGGNVHTFAGKPEWESVRDPVWRGMLYPRFETVAHLDEALGRQGAGPGQYDVTRDVYLGGPRPQVPLWWNSCRSSHAGIITKRPVGELDTASVVAPKMPFSVPPKLGSEKRPGPGAQFPTLTRTGDKVDVSGVESRTSRFGTDKQRWRADVAQENDNCKSMPGGWHQPFISAGHLQHENLGTFSPGPIYNPETNTVKSHQNVTFTTNRSSRGFSFGSGERFNYGNGMSSGGMAIPGKLWTNGTREKPNSSPIE